MRGLLVRVRAEHGLRVVPFHVGRAEREVKAMEADAGSETRFRPGGPATKMALRASRRLVKPLGKRYVRTLTTHWLPKN
jgi:hypothetical protein